LPRNLLVLASAVLAPTKTLGNTDQCTVGRGLPALALPRGHALNLVHATPGRTPTIAKTLDTPQFQSLGESADQACDVARPGAKRNSPIIPPT